MALSITEEVQISSICDTNEEDLQSKTSSSHSTVKSPLNLSPMSTNYMNESNPNGLNTPLNVASPLIVSEQTVEIQIDSDVGEDNLIPTGKADGIIDNEIPGVHNYIQDKSLVSSLSHYLSKLDNTKSNEDNFDGDTEEPNSSMNHSTININPNSEEEEIKDTCRICYGDDSTEGFITLCKCSGTLKSVHKSCIEMWFASRYKKRCELCKTKYTVQKIDKPWFQYFSGDKVKILKFFTKAATPLISIVSAFFIFSLHYQLMEWKMERLDYINKILADGGNLTDEFKEDFENLKNGRYTINISEIDKILICTSSLLLFLIGFWSFMKLVKEVEKITLWRKKNCKVKIFYRNVE